MFIILKIKKIKTISMQFLIKKAKKMITHY